MLFVSEPTIRAKATLCYHIRHDMTKHNEILITTGLLKYIPSAEGFIGVIAHEIGHLVGRHSMRQILQAASVTALSYFYQVHLCIYLY